MRLLRNALDIKSNQYESFFIKKILWHISQTWRLLSSAVFVLWQEGGYISGSSSVHSDAFRKRPLPRFSRIFR